MNPVKAAQPGTPIFLVPIRFWEVQEPQTCHIVEHGEIGREAHAKDEKSIYAFHDGYGHNVYLDSEDCFLTREEAIAEAHRRISVKNAEEEAEMEVIMAKILANRKQG